MYFLIKCHKNNECALKNMVYLSIKILILYLEIFEMYLMGNYI